MKRILLVLGSCIAAFAGVSCEKHLWEDKVEVVEEKIYENGQLIGTQKTEVVVEKGAKRFFIEDKKKASEPKH